MQAQLSSTNHAARHSSAYRDTLAAFHALSESIREGAALVALDGTILACNRRLADMLKLDGEQVTGRAVLDLIASDDQPRFEQLFRSFPDETPRLEVRLTGGNATLLPAELVVKRIPVDGTHMFSLVTTDLTERRRAEQALLRQAQRHAAEIEKHAQEMSQYAEKMKAYAAERQDRAILLERRISERTAELEAEQARWRGVVESMADEVWVMDVDGLVKLINLPNETEMGLAEFEGRTVEQVFEAVEIINLDGEVLPPEQAPLLRALKGEIVRGEEIMRHRKTGRTRYRQFSAAPTRDASGAITGSVAIVRDITDQKQAEREHERLRRELERRAVELEIANKELDSFTYSVSHDLRTPLTAIEGFSRMLQEDYGPQLPAKASEYVELVLAGTHQMQDLIEALLRLSRLSRHALEKQRVNMTTLVMEAMELLQQEPTRQDLTLDVQDLPEAEADPVLIKQVWVNLIANALKFTRKRDRPRIEIGCGDYDGQDHVYYVRDNGIGFDMEQAERLYGVFQRLHGEEEYEGSGIGLAIVQRIVVRHGGRVWAEGQVGQGATFYFTLE